MNSQSPLHTTLQTKNLIRHNDLVVTYLVQSKDLEKAADAIAIGQSVGNPNLRLDGETKEMWDQFGCSIRSIDPEASVRGRGKVIIGYPLKNFTQKSLTHLLVSVMGGQMDIDIIEGCQLTDIQIPEEMVRQYKGPNHGIKGIRDYLGAMGRPLVGGIVKPKTGITPDKLADICKQMADGGIDFIKEDEILGAIDHCPFKDRVEKVSKALKGHKVIYAPCVTSPIADFPEVAKIINQSLAAPAFHYNIWGGLDAFKYLAELVGGFSFYQKSGDRVITDGRFSIDFTVWCRLARLAGADFIHAGMIGGYLDEPVEMMRRRLDALAAPWYGLKTTLGSLSCGATPGMVQGMVSKLGIDIMVSSGGCLHAHPKGSFGGAKAFRDAAEGKNSDELAVAVQKFGR